MRDILGQEISRAEEILKVQNMKYVIEEYTAVKPMENVDIKRVVRIKEKNNVLTLTICGFKGNAI